MSNRNTEHFIALTDWSGERLERVIDLAVRLERRNAIGRDPGVASGRHMVLLFQKPSLRTRLSFEIGWAQLGGSATYMSPTEVGLGERESVADVARVIGRYADVIVARVFGHGIIEELAAASPIPVINGLSDYNHPCQIMADLMTMAQRRKTLEGLHVAWIGDGNNVATSWINAARRLPIRVTLACPEGYDPDPSVLAEAEKEANGRVRVVRDAKEAVAEADVLYADTWCSMGQEDERDRRRADLAAYQIDEALLSSAPDHAVVMHCLPAHRGDEITDGVMDGDQSVVFDQAENRLHAQKAVVLSVLRTENSVP